MLTLLDGTTSQVRTCKCCVTNLEFSPLPKIANAPVDFTLAYLYSQELLNEQNRKQASLTRLARCGRWCANIAVTASVLGCISVALWGLWELVSWRAAQHWETVVSLAVTAVLAVCPLLFHAVARSDTLVKLKIHWLNLRYSSWIQDTVSSGGRLRRGNS